MIRPDDSYLPFDAGAMVLTFNVAPEPEPDPDPLTEWTVPAARTVRVAR